MKKKQVIKLNERQVIKMVKQILKETYNQFDDSDFASADPYYNDDDLDYNYGPLDGYWNFNHCDIKIKDYNDEVKFDIINKEGRKTYTIEDEEAKILKSKILYICNKEHMGIIKPSIWQCIYPILIKRNLI